MKPSLVILAAGIGSRYGGLKQVDQVGPSGEIIIDYSVYDAIRAGFGKVIFVIRPDFADAFKALMEPHVGERIVTEYVYQELTDLPSGYTAPPNRMKPWGTAHALRAARHALQEPFGVINADDFYGAHTFTLLHRHLSAIENESRDFCLVPFELGNTLSEHGSVSRGLCELNEDGTLRQVVERHGIRWEGGRITYAHGGIQEEVPLKQPTSMTVWGFSPLLLATLEECFETFMAEHLASIKDEFYLPTLVTHLIQNRLATFTALTTTSKWLGITHPADKPAVVDGIRNLVAAGVYPDSLWDA